MAEVTPYLSPVRLLIHAGETPEAPTLQSISRARKRLIAELSLNGNELVLDERHYSRNDIQKLLDESQLQELQMHAEVYANTPLRLFLEDQQFRADNAAPDLWNIHQDWVPIISSGLGYSFQTLSREQLNAEEYKRLTQMMPLAAFILPEHQEEAFSKIRAYLHDLNYTVRNLSWEKFSADESVLHFLFSSEWRSMINEVAIYYPEEVQDLVMKVLDRVFHFQRKATWNYLAEVCKCLTAIRTNSFAQAEVHRFLAVFEDNIQKVKKQNRSNWKSYIFYAIWIVVLIARIGGSCNSGSRSSSFSNSYYSTNNDLRELLQRQVVTYTALPNYHLKLDTLAHYNIDKTLRRLTTGQIPFYGMHDAFTKGGNSDLKVINLTKFDMIVMLTQKRDEDLFAGIANYMIRRGDSLKINIPNQGSQANFLLGKGWVKLSDPVKLSNLDQDSVYSIAEYFENPIIPQPWMRSTFYLGSQPGTAGMSRIGIYRQAYDDRHLFELRFFMEKNTLTYNVQGNDMIYLDNHMHERDSL